MKLGKKINLKNLIKWTSCDCSNLSTIFKNTKDFKDKSFNQVTIDSISTDSRTIKMGDFFIPIVGPNFNGHDFILEAVNKGCSGFIYQQDNKEKVKFLIQNLSNKENLIILESKNNITFLLNLAKNYLKQFNVKTIGITGSYGKTTTKDFTVNILQKQFKIKYTPQNFNTEIGISKSVLEINNDTEFFVAELGMRGKDQIAELADVLNLDIAAITAIGPVHLEFFSDIKEIAIEKAKIVNPFKEKIGKNGGVLFLNNDDMWSDFIENYVNKDMMNNIKNTKIIRFGSFKDKDNDCFIFNSIDGKNSIDSKKNNKNQLIYRYKIIETDEFSRYTFSFYKYDKKVTEIKVPIAGIHNVSNACLAAAICFYLGVDKKKIKEGIEKAIISDKRMDVICKNEMIILNDCYNANPDSMKCAIDTLKLISEKHNKRSIALLADMFELGCRTDEFHYEIGKYLKEKKIDILIAVGKHAKKIFDGFNQTNDYQTGQKAYYFKSVKDLLNNLSRLNKLSKNNDKDLNGFNIICKKDVILIKGSRANKLEEIVELISSKNF